MRTNATLTATRVGARGSRPATPSGPGRGLLTLQRQAGNAAVTQLVTDLAPLNLQRCGCDGACGGCGPELPLQLLAAAGPLLLQRKAAPAARASAAPKSMELSDAGVAFIARWEGFRGKLYRDAAGLWTIGYGHLVKPGEMTRFRKGITEPQGRKLLAQDAQIAVNGVRRLITVSLNQTQFDVLVSFAFNVGVGALEESTLRRKLNAGSYGAVPTELRKWVNAGGRPVQGLVNRRNEEASLWRSSGGGGGSSGGGTAKPPPLAAQPVLRFGSRGAAVARLQRALAKKGLSPGRADGIFGARTRSAVVAFQRRRRLVPDGVVGARTWRALSAGTTAPGPSKPPAPKPAKPTARPVLRLGSKGRAVKDLQRLLAARGFSAGGADGVFGPRTQGAVIAYQRSRGLAADGVAGTQTWRALQTNAPARPAPPGGGSPGGGGNVDTDWVGGIQVAASLAPKLRALLAAARRDGLKLSGWGYRSAKEQIALRRQNCGTSHYDIWQKPSSQCSPPTAIPGRSMHEQGLAVDFTNCGAGSPAFKWLVKNASRFGLYNLPSESWHWSTNGR